MSFGSLGLSEALLRAVTNEGYENPTPIQARAIPLVLEGHDLLAAAQTGTGKTAAFTLPLLQRLVEGTAKRQPRALVLTPTRELAAQVAESMTTYGRGLSLRHTVIFGGVGHQPQIDALRRGVDVIVATPGRLLEHVSDGHADLSQVEFFVLDEADRMLDMGFIHDIRRVLKVLPSKRQNLLFSATFSEDIRRLAKTFLHNPQEVDIAPRNATVETVEQRVMFADQREKRQLLSHLIHTGGWQQVLVFARMKHGANRICEHLIADGLPAAALHGNKSQSARTRALSDFKTGKIRVLVATDIAARGIDIDQLPHVINFELPNVPEDYVHRIGRTGRAGNEGEALSLVAPDERQYLKDIQKLIKREIQVLAIPADFVPRPMAPEPPRPDRPPQRRPARAGGGGQPQRSSSAQPRPAGGRGAGAGAGASAGASSPGNQARPQHARPQQARPSHQPGARPARADSRPNSGAGQRPGPRPNPNVRDDSFGNTFPSSRPATSHRDDLHAESTDSSRPEPGNEKFPPPRNNSYSPAARGSQSPGNGRGRPGGGGQGAGQGQGARGANAGARGNGQNFAGRGAAPSGERTGNRIDSRPPSGDQRSRRPPGKPGPRG